MIMISVMTPDDDVTPMSRYAKMPQATAKIAKSKGKC